MKMRERPRRNRKNESIRRLVRESSLDPSDLIAPLFVIEGEQKREEIPSMPGQYRWSGDLLLEKASSLYERGIRCVALFPALPEHLKNPQGTESYNSEGTYLRLVRQLKDNLPELVIMTDVAMDPYSSDGHDGLVDSVSGEILNDETLEILGAMALAQAEAGSDMIGPSDMMDGRVGSLRDLLDREGFTQTSLISYTAKYASSFYGPFRDALFSAPKKGDKKSYQMDPANIKEALREARLDEREGADILMVKPGLAYLDILRAISEQSSLPTAVYNVSGEYAMVKAAEEKGWIDGEAVMLEMLMAFKRARASMIVTYFAEEAAEILG